MLAEEPSDDLWGSVHESAHCVTARYFRLEVERATMDRVIIPHHRKYTGADDFFERLIISESGDVATVCFLEYSDPDSVRQHHTISMRRLTVLGANTERARYLIEMSRRAAYDIVPRFEAEILTLAQALRRHRTMTGIDIERALAATMG